MEASSVQFVLLTDLKNKQTPSPPLSRVEAENPEHTKLQHIKAVESAWTHTNRGKLLCVLSELVL